MASKNFDIKGLTNEKVLTSRKEHGENVLAYKKRLVFLIA
jgi:hypothetical protein